MKMNTVIRKLLPVSAMAILGLCCVAQSGAAQSSKTNNDAVAAQDQQAQQPDASKQTESKIFSGKIVKTGNMLVLTDTDGKTTYKLDDQLKAKDFVNKDVKVTGVLDASTGMIRVTAIEPA